MSFDLMAFDPDATTEADFPAWYARVTAWDGDRPYDDISIATPALRAFYSDLVEVYPPMNGPGAPSQDDLDADPQLDEWLTDYSIDSQLIYAAFAWSKRTPASAMVAALATSHGLALAFVSQNPIRIAWPRPARQRWPFLRRP